jgi:hypothetical protein
MRVLVKEATGERGYAGKHSVLGNGADGPLSLFRGDYGIAPEPMRSLTSHHTICSSQPFYLQQDTHDWSIQATSCDAPAARASDHWEMVQPKMA